MSAKQPGKYSCSNEWIRDAFKVYMLYKGDTGKRKSCFKEINLTYIRGLNFVFMIDARFDYSRITSDSQIQKS